MENNNITNDNPWKGLNYYKEGEVLYGRDEEIQSLSLHILSNTQTVVYGKSGIGKSSIINAGVFPIAREQGYYPIPIRLSHESEQSYVEQIRNAFVKYKISIKEVVPVIDAEKESLWEFLHRHAYYHPLYGTPVRPLIVLDQFEEIFTLQKSEKDRREFFAQLADVLNDIVPRYILDSQKNQIVAESATPGKPFKLDFGGKQGAEPRYIKESNFTIVFVIREDFLSYLERYTRYIPIMKNNRYALLPLNEEQAAEIIMKPREGLIDHEVANLIIQKVTERADIDLDGQPEIEVSAAVLSLYLSRIYNKKGDSPVITADMVSQYSENIIRDFYEESIADIPQEHVEKLEDMLLTYDGRRDSMTLNDLIREGIPRDEIIFLTGKRKILRLFNYRNDDRVEYMHDVLCKVIVERIEQRELNAAHTREMELKRRTRIMKMCIAAFVAFAIGVGFCVWDYYFHNIEKRYGRVIKKDGWFQGLEKLSKDESSHRAVHFVLKYHGRRAFLKRPSHPYVMEARDGYDKLTTNHDIHPYILNHYDDSDKGADKGMKENIKKICQWEFVPDASGDFVLQERTLDKDGNLIFVYNRSKTEEPNKMLGTYTDEKGFPLMLRDSSYFYLLTTYDNRGFETHMAFCNEYGYPIPNKDGAYQTEWEYLSNGIKKAEYSCFLDGRHMVDRCGNCGWIVLDFTPDSIRETLIVYVDDDGNPCRIKRDSIYAKRWEYEHGNMVKESYWLTYDTPDTCGNGYHCVEYEFNDKGQITHMQFKDREGNACATADGLWSRTYDYNNQGCIVCEIWNYTDSICGYFSEFENGERVLCKYYVIPISKDGTKGDTVWTYEYYKDLNKRISLIIDRDEGIFQRSTYDDHGAEIKVEQFRETDANRINNASVKPYYINTMVHRYEGDTTYISDIAYLDSGDTTYHKEIMVDSLHCSISTLNYDNEGNFENGYRKIFSNKNFDRLLAQESIDENWNTVRYYSDYEPFYYRANLILSYKQSEMQNDLGKYAVSECGEPSLVRHGGYTYHCIYRYKGRDYYYNDKGQRINPIDDKWPILAYIELKKPTSNIGFRTGDIVLNCNNWYMKFYDSDPELSFSGNNWWKNIDRNFIVARYNPGINDYDTVHVFVPEAVYNIDDYIDFKKCRCTFFEKEHIQMLIWRYLYKRMVYASVQDTVCPAYREIGLRGDLIVLEWNNWNFLRNNAQDFRDSLAKYTGANKRVTYIDYETDTIGYFETDVDVVGLRWAVNSFKSMYYDIVVDKYNEYINNK